MKGCETKQRIDKFNQENPPFYIIDHNDGEFSLCLPLDFLDGEYYPYCQDAFDAYAEEIGEPPTGRNGMKTHGSGYEWAAAFKEAFKDDPNISKILFNCEAGGFFCYAYDLPLMEDFGVRFKKICEDIEGFIPIVSAGIKNAAAWEAQQERLMKTVRGQLMKNPSSSFEIMTPDGNISITPENGKALIDESLQFIKIDGVNFSANELLDQEITDMQRDLFDQSLIRLKTEEPQETMSMLM